MSQYNDSIFYFIGTSNITNYVNMAAVKNVTLHGLDQSPLIYCRNEVSIDISNSNRITISNISFRFCPLRICSSSNIAIANSSFTATERSDVSKLELINAFDKKLSSSVFIHYDVFIRVSMQSSTPTHTRTHFSIQPGNEFYYSGYC